MVEFSATFSKLQIIQRLRSVRGIYLETYTWLYVKSKNAKFYPCKVWVPKLVLHKLFWSHTNFSKGFSITNLSEMLKFTTNQLFRKSSIIIELLEIRRYPIMRSDHFEGSLIFQNDFCNYSQFKLQKNDSENKLESELECKSLHLIR